MPYLNQDNQTTTGTQGQGRTPLPINTAKAVDRAAGPLRTETQQGWGPGIRFKSKNINIYIYRQIKLYDAQPSLV